MQRKSRWMLLVNAGILIFVCLYYAATFFYPGGSQADTYSIGFSWSDNYWCNLLDAKAINGANNNARPLAIAAMLLLCMTLAVFWYWFPELARLGKIRIQIIRYAGLAAMTTALFLFAGPHDLVINTASLFGLVSVIGTIVGLNQLKWKNLFTMGILNLGLIAVNNICYYNKGLLPYLPTVQKITFILFLLWISLISISLSKSN